ncbi:MAG: glycoside hydrolase family 3 N-terminal domain-containing protein [Coriobacteriales bacterium]|jgi:beta-glucosidase
MKIKKHPLVGSPSIEEREYEVRHREVSRRAAADGMVLLKNDGNLLPVAPGAKVALYGAGAVETIKGGTGSGDVNSRRTVNVRDGLLAAGYDIVTLDWLSDYEARYTAAREAWRDEIFRKANDYPDPGMAFFFAYSSTPFQMPEGDKLDFVPADVAVYVLSRIAGEGADRRVEKGDWFPTDYERRDIEFLCESYEHVVLVLNVGGPVDLGFTDGKGHIEAILLMHQPGMEAGNAFADVFSGKVAPSGKLTDSWALSYEDYPNAGTFSHRDGNVNRELYVEGIYVGYRYFDTFEVKARYPFGYGLSYTSFKTEFSGIEMSGSRSSGGFEKICVSAKVENVGAVGGREVVQAYVSCPHAKLGGEFRRLVAFAKTGLLEAGKSETVKLEFGLDDLASFDADFSSYVLERGDYIVFLGGSIDDSVPIAIVSLDDDAVLVKTRHICPVQEQLEEISPDSDAVEARRLDILRRGELPRLDIKASGIETKEVEYGDGWNGISKDVRDFVDSLDVEQLVTLSSGAITWGEQSALGSAGMRVPGSAAQTSECASEQGLADIVLADGPAGLRLIKEYEVVDGVVQPVPFEKSFEDGFLCTDEPEHKGQVMHQFCTAFPTGTCLAQTWDVNVLHSVGRAVSEEMREFDVTLWLAPGMNVHRNPLCGRNFEYYSEDPLLSGKMAAAITEGVQSIPGYGTTIKHFACNNQEDNRMGSDSIVSERALREIYLRNFQIAVMDSHPMALMTSYNKVNGVHAANNHDLCTDVLRSEWGYEGLVMTDWTTTMYGPDCTAVGCMIAGNDSVMPGSPQDHQNIRDGLDSGELEMKDLKRSIARLVKTVWGSDRYEK